MSNIVYISTHKEDAVARLASQFKDRPLIAGLIMSFVKQHQDMEDTVQQLLTERLLDTAVGEQLDGFGGIVGEHRNGRNDDDYRLAIKARIGRNTSEGTPDDVINVFNILTGSTQTQLVEFSPAVITLTANVNFSNEAAIKAYAQKVVAAGVRIDWIAKKDPAGPPFAFFGVGGGAGYDQGIYTTAF